MINIIDSAEINGRAESPSSVLEYILNPFFRIKMKIPYECEMLLDNKTIQLSDSAYIRFITSIQGVLEHQDLLISIAEHFKVDGESAENILQELIDNKLIVCKGEYDDKLPGVKHWIQRGWLDALILHLKTRNIDCDDDLANNSRAFNRAKFASKIDIKGLPNIWKVYEKTSNVSLPTPREISSEESIFDIMLRRRSYEPWKNNSIDLDVVSSLLVNANSDNIQNRKTLEKEYGEQPETILNSSFCALETYVFANSVNGLDPGLYHYDLKNSRLSLLKLGNYSTQISKMCIGQRKAGSAPCVFVISAVFERYMYRYKHARAYRNLLINVSELAHRYILLSTSHRLSTFLTPALRDEYADTLIGLNGYQEAPLYVVSVG